MVDFSLPGQPGTDTANKIDAEFHAGGKTQPYLVSITMPAGQSVASNTAAIGSAFASVTAKVPDTRLVDEANTGDANAFRTKDGRTAYAMVFYRFLHNPTSSLPTDKITATLKAAAPSGSIVGVTGDDALAAGKSSGGGPGRPGRDVPRRSSARWSCWPSSSLRFWRSFLWWSRRCRSWLPSSCCYRSPTLTHVSFIVEFLVALIGLGVAIDYSLLLVTRWREERDHGRDNHDAVVVAMETAGRAVVFSGVTVAIGLIALVVLPVPFMRSIGIGGALIPLASVLTTLTLTPAILGGIGPRVDWPQIRHENQAEPGLERPGPPAWCATGSPRRRRRSHCSGALFVSFLGIKIGAGLDPTRSRKHGPAYERYTAFWRTAACRPASLTPMEILVATISGAVGAVAGSGMSRRAAHRGLHRSGQRPRRPDRRRRHPDRVRR